MNSDIKIQSKTDIKKISKQCLKGELSSEEILDYCRELWSYAGELTFKGRQKDNNSKIDFKNIHDIRSVCDAIQQLCVHLETDEQKLKVLSMTSGRPCLSAISAMASISGMSLLGFPRVSKWIALVSSFMAFSTSDRSWASTKVVLIPYWGSVCSKRLYVPP